MLCLPICSIDVHMSLNETARVPLDEIRTAAILSGVHNIRTSLADIVFKAEPVSSKLRTHVLIALAVGHALDVLACNTIEITFEQQKYYHPAL